MGAATALMEWMDVQVGIEWLKEVAGVGKVVLWGHSMGAATALMVGGKMGVRKERMEKGKRGWRRSRGGAEGMGRRRAVSDLLTKGRQSWNDCGDDDDDDDDNNNNNNNGGYERGDRRNEYVNSLDRKSPFRKSIGSGSGSSPQKEDKSASTSPKRYKRLSIRESFQDAMMSLQNGNKKPDQRDTNGSSTILSSSKPPLPDSPPNSLGDTDFTTSSSSPPRESGAPIKPNIEIDGLILDSPYASFDKIAQGMVHEIPLPPGVPKKLVLSVGIRAIRRVVKEKANFDIHDINPLEAAKHCTLPVFILHGMKDKTITPDHSQLIYTHYKGKNKTLVLLERDDHESVRPPDVYDQIFLFLQRVLRGSDGGKEGVSSVRGRNKASRRRRRKSQIEEEEEENKEDGEKNKEDGEKGQKGQKGEELEEDTSFVEAIKARGNDAIIAGRYRDAIKLYSAALDVLWRKRKNNEGSKSKVNGMGENDYAGHRTSTVGRESSGGSSSRVKRARERFSRSSKDFIGRWSRTSRPVTNTIFDEVDERRRPNAPDGIEHCLDRVSSAGNIQTAAMNGTMARDTNQHRFRPFSEDLRGFGRTPDLGPPPVPRRKERRSSRKQQSSKASAKKKASPSSTRDFDADPSSSTKSKSRSAIRRFFSSLRRRSSNRKRKTNLFDDQALSNGHTAGEAERSAGRYSSASILMDSSKRPFSVEGSFTIDDGAHSAEKPTIEKKDPQSLDVSEWELTDKCRDMAVALFGNRSLAKGKLGDHAAALRDAESAIRLNPKWLRGYLRKATALKSLSRLEEAAATLDAGLKIDPDNRSLLDMSRRVRHSLTRCKSEERCNGFSAAQSQTGDTRS